MICLSILSINLKVNLFINKTIQISFSWSMCSWCPNQIGVHHRLPAAFSRFSIPNILVRHSAIQIYIEVISWRHVWSSLVPDRSQNLDTFHKELQSSHHNHHIQESHPWTIEICHPSYNAPLYLIFIFNQSHLCEASSSEVCTASTTINNRNNSNCQIMCPVRDLNCWTLFCPFE